MATIRGPQYVCSFFVGLHEFMTPANQAKVAVFLEFYLLKPWNNLGRVTLTLTLTRINITLTRIKS